MAALSQCLPIILGVIDSTAIVLKLLPIGVVFASACYYGGHAVVQVMKGVTSFGADAIHVPLSLEACHVQVIADIPHGKDLYIHIIGVHLWFHTSGTERSGCSL